MNGNAELLALLAEETERPATQGAESVAAAVLGRHGGAVQALLFYGSCFREGTDSDGILDLCVLVDRYRNVHGSSLLALSNRLLPPNVFYLEVRSGERIVRAKYATVSLADFARRTSARAFDPYFWARFAQPCALVYARSHAVREAVIAALAAAVVAFLESGLPLLPPRCRMADLWTRTLRETYRAELRPERADRPHSLYEAFAERYERATRAALPRLRFSAVIETDRDGSWIRTEIPPHVRLRAPLVWGLRRAWGKGLALLRLLKGAFTFEGGIEYAFWKIERHSGVSVDPSWRRGRLRLLGLGLTFWRVYRRGAFREEGRRRNRTPSNPSRS